MAAWRVPGWARLFDCTLGRHHRGVEWSIAPRMPGLRALTARAGGADFLLSGTGMLVVLTREEVFYLPLGPSPSGALERSKAIQAELARARDPFLASLVDYAFELEGEGRSLQGRATRLLPVAPADLEETLTRALEMLRGPLGRGTLPEHVAHKVLSALEAAGGERPRLEARARTLLARSWTLARAHGDLTPANLMRFGTEPRLIDLDRFQPIFPALYDPLHFTMEAAAKETRRAWLEVLAEEERGRLAIALPRIEKFESGLARQDALDLYLLLRIGLEWSGAKSKDRRLSVHLDLVEWRLGKEPSGLAGMRLTTCSAPVEADSTRGW